MFFLEKFFKTHNKCVFFTVLWCFWKRREYSPKIWWNKEKHWRPELREDRDTNPPGLFAITLINTMTDIRIVKGLFGIHILITAHHWGNKGRNASRKLKTGTKAEAIEELCVLTYFQARVQLSFLFVRSSRQGFPETMESVLELSL